MKQKTWFLIRKLGYALVRRRALMVVCRKIIGGVVDSDSVRRPKCAPFGSTCCPYLNGLTLKLPEPLEDMVPGTSEAHFGRTGVAKTSMEALSLFVYKEPPAEATYLKPVVIHMHSNTS